MKRKHAPVQESIRRALLSARTSPYKIRSLTTKEVHEMVGGSYESVSGALNTMRLRGRVFCLSVGGGGARSVWTDLKPKIVMVQVRMPRHVR